MFDMLLGLVAVVAIAGAGFFGLKVWLSGGPQTPREVSVAALASSPSGQVVPVVWTKADNDICVARGRAAARNPDTSNYRITNRSISEGVAGLSTILECQLTRKVGRFCGGEGKAQLVALVNEYYGRMDMVTLGIGVQGAPMALAGAMFGGEPAAGDAIYQDMARDTLAYMQSYNARVVKALRGLGRNGVIAAEDFRSFPLAGVPENIATIFEGVRTTGTSCAGT